MHNTFCFAALNAPNNELDMKFPSVSGRARRQTKTEPMSSDSPSTPQQDDASSGVPSGASETPVSAVSGAGDAVSGTNDAGLAPLPAEADEAVRALTASVVTATQPALDELQEMLTDLEWSQQEVVNMIALESGKFIQGAEASMAKLMETFDRLPVYQNKVKVLTKRLHTLQARVGKVQHGSIELEGKVREDVQRRQAQEAGKKKKKEQVVPSAEEDGAAVDGADDAAPDAGAVETTATATGDSDVVFVDDDSIVHGEDDEEDDEDGDELP